MRAAVQERVKVGLFVAALVATAVAGWVWLFPESITSIQDIQGEWVGVDCSEDPPVARAFDDHIYDTTDAAAACDDVDEGNTSKRRATTAAALAFWGGAIVAGRRWP